MNKKKNEGESRNLKKLESLLVEQLVSSNVKNTDFGEDLINFSDSSESEETIDVSEQDLIDSDCYESVSEEGDESDELSVKLKEILSRITSSGDSDCMEVPETESGLAGGGRQEFTMATPFKFRDSQGSLFCSLCRWTSQDNSVESFLTHCKTHAHKVNVRARFIARNSESEETQREQEVRKPVAAPKNVIQKNLIKKPVETENSSGKPKGEKEVSNKNKKVKKNVKKANAKRQNGEEPSMKNETSSSKGDTDINLNLKAIILAKGMTYIRPHSGNKLKCSMCNKTIPPAPDISILMRNVSHHLQSKKHLKKLLEKETELKTSMKQKAEKTKKKKQVKTSVPEPPNEGQKNVQEKTLTQTVQEKEELLENRNTFKLVDKTPKVLFQCIPCNYFNKNRQKFESHLNSKTHLDCFTSKGVSIDLPYENFKCKSCGWYLYGSLHCINQHYSKCSKH